MAENSNALASSCLPLYISVMIMVADALNYYRTLEEGRMAMSCSIGLKSRTNMIVVTSMMDVMRVKEVIQYG